MMHRTHHAAHPRRRARAPGTTLVAAVSVTATLVAATVATPPAEAGTFDAWLERAEHRALFMPADTDAGALLDGPAAIAYDVDTDPGDDAFMAVSSDVHGVYRVSFETLAQTIADLDSHENFVPHVAGSRARRTGSDPPEWLQHVELSSGFLFFRVDQSFENRHVVLRIDEDRFALVFRLNESYDALVSDIHGAWYLERVVIDGGEHVYVRYFNHVVFSRRTAGLRFAVRSFGLRDAKNAIAAYVSEARRRSP